MEKEILRQAVHELLSSATKRGTTQGVIVYTNVLRLLEQVSTSTEVDLVRKELNQSLTGMEAHGYFTDSEYLIVRRLRGPE